MTRDNFTCFECELQEGDLILNFEFEVVWGIDNDQAVIEDLILTFFTVTDLNHCIIFEGEPFNINYELADFYIRFPAIEHKAREFEAKTNDLWLTEKRGAEMRDERKD